MHASMCARPVLAFEVPIRRRARFSLTGGRSAREAVADSGLRRHGHRLEKRRLVEGLRVVSGGLSLRGVRLTRRGVRAHVRRRAKLVVGSLEGGAAGVEVTASCWEYVARAAAARGHLGFWDRCRKEAPTDG